MRRDPGFSMVELVVVIAITSIVASLALDLITRPLWAYGDVTRRSELVAAAGTAMRRMARDVQRSLPNSLRVAGAGAALELMYAADGARYREDPGVNTATTEDHTAASDVLSFGPDAQWNLLGRFGALGFTYGVPLAAGHRVAVYPTGAAVWTEAATSADPGSITPAGTSITIQDDVDEDQILLSSTFQFALSSPRRRLYVVEEPITYLCSAGAGTLTRYSGYAMAAAQPTDPSVAPLSGAASALLSRRVSSCTFSYAPGTPARAGLVTIELVLAAGDEQVRLLQQVHVGNAP